MENQSNEVPACVRDTKQFRCDLDEVLSRLTGSMNQAVEGGRSSRERSLAKTKLQEAIMWLGMDLKAMREEGITEGTGNPYPKSYDPSSPDIEPTADGLNLGSSKEG